MTEEAEKHIRRAAIPMLIAAGVTPELLDAALSLIDPSALTVNPAGGVTGLAAEIKALRSDLPELWPMFRFRR